MTSDWAEVRELLDALEPKFAQCNDQFSAKEIGYVLVGMNLMDRTVPEVAALMSQVSIKVATSELQGQPNLDFLVFGRAVRVKVGEYPQGNADLNNRLLSRSLHPTYP